VREFLQPRLGEEEGGMWREKEGGMWRDERGQDEVETQVIFA